MRTAMFSIALVIWICPLATAQAPAGAAAATAAPALGPLTLTPAIVSCTDLPTTRRAGATELRVLGLHHGDRRLNAARGDLIVLSGGVPQGLAIGQRYFARRVMKPVDHGPVTAANPAAVVTSGWLTIAAVDTQSALARVDHACVAIEAGDYLEPYVDPALPAALASAGRTDFSARGQVLLGRFRRSSFGAGDVLSVDSASSNALTIGTRLAFYRDRRIGTPLVALGEGIVVEVSAGTAKVVLERAAQEIRTGDYYGVRGRP